MYWLKFHVPDPRVKMCLWMMTVRKCIVQQSWSSRKKQLAHQCWSCLCECCLLLCGCSKRAALSMDLCDWSSVCGTCPFSYWEYILNLMTDCALDFSGRGTGGSTPWVLNSIKFCFSGSGRSTSQLQNSTGPNKLWESLLSISKLSKPHLSKKCKTML